VANGYHSQRVGERRLHLGLCWLLGAAALLAMPLALATPPAAFVLLILAQARPG
jgi:hypothetical protein